jgi:hypothetical protein
VLWKTLLTVPTSSMLGAAVIAPNAALAQLPPLPVAPLPVAPLSVFRLWPCWSPWSRPSSWSRSPWHSSLSYRRRSSSWPWRSGQLFSRLERYTSGHTATYGYGRSGYAYGNGSKAIPLLGTLWRLCLQQFQL